MTVAALALALLQVQDPTPLGPVAPAGASKGFYESVLNVQDLLAAGDVAAAKKAMGAMPMYKPKIWFDGSGLNAEQKTAYRAVVERAMASWARLMPEFEPTLQDNGPAQIKIGFSPRLENAPEGWPQGATFMTSIDPADPQITTTIGLERGAPVVPVMSDEVYNETLFSIAHYLGLGQTLRTGQVTWRTDLPGANRVQISPLETSAVKRVMTYVDSLREVVNKGQKIRAARPQLALEHNEMTVPGVVQGEAKVFDIQVSNHGNAPLSMRVEAECACYAPAAPPVIEPGKTGLIRIGVNSRDFVGSLKKKIRITSNDPDFPVRELPISIEIKPQFRILAEASPYEIPEEGGTTHLYLLLDEAVTWKPQEIRVDGFKNVSSFEPWEGEIADPEIGVAKAKRKGYRITVEFEPQRFTGKSMATCMVFTDSQDPMFATIRKNFEVMRGIYANPGEIFFGEIPAAPASAFFFLARPGKPFKILGVTSDNPFLTGEAAKFRGDDEWRVVVKFNGKMDPGLLSGIITVKTDDPKQPNIEIPVQGTVR